MELQVPLLDTDTLLEAVEDLIRHLQLLAVPEEVALEHLRLLELVLGRQEP